MFLFPSVIMALKTLSNPDPQANFSRWDHSPVRENRLWNDHNMSREQELVGRPEKHIMHMQVEIRVEAQ